MNPRWSITPSHPSAHHHHHRLPPLPPLPPPRWPPSRGPGPTRSLPRPPPTVPLPLLRRAVPRLRQRNKPRRHSPARRKKRKKRKQRRRGHKEEPPSWGSGRPTKTCWTSTASPSAATASTERRRSMDQSGEAESRGGGALRVGFPRQQRQNVFIWVRTGDTVSSCEYNGDDPTGVEAGGREKRH